MDNIAQFDMVGIQPFCAKSATLSWVKVIFFNEVAKNLWDVAHLAHVTCYVFGYMEYAGAVLGDSVKWWQCP
jgi:hypothetical protein